MKNINKENKEASKIFYSVQEVIDDDNKVIDISLYFDPAQVDSLSEQNRNAFVECVPVDEIKKFDNIEEFSLYGELYKLIGYMQILNHAIHHKTLDINKKFINDRASFVSVVIDFYQRQPEYKILFELFKTLLQNDADLKNVCSIDDKDQIEDRPSLIKSIYNMLEY